MTKFKRLSAEERKKQICDAAKKCFLAKGFQKTTMEDVVAVSGMSKGGLYNYYKSTEDMFYDIMVEGSHYRMKLVKAFMDAHPHCSKREYFVETLVDKLIDQNEYKSLYAMFVLEARQNERFKVLDERLFQSALEIMEQFASSNGFVIPKYMMDPFMTTLFKTFYVGMECLDNRDAFYENRDLLKKWLYAMFKEEDFHGSKDTEGTDSKE